MALPPRDPLRSPTRHAGEIPGVVARPVTVASWMGCGVGALQVRAVRRLRLRAAPPRRGPMP